MGWIASWIGALVAPAVIKAVLKRILVALGVSAFQVTGVMILMNQVEAYIAGKFGDVAADVMAVLNTFGLKESISIIVGAVFTRLTMNGLTNAGSLSRIYWDKSASVVLN